MDSQETLAVVVPAYNEGEGLRQFHARLAGVFDGLAELSCLVIYVDDGSSDDTWAVIESLAARGAQAIILGCTEISLLIKPEHSDLPLLDTTELHAQAAVAFALG